MSNNTHINSIFIIALILFLFIIFLKTERQDYDLESYKQLKRIEFRNLRYADSVNNHNFKKKIDSLNTLSLKYIKKYDSLVYINSKLVSKTSRIEKDYNNINAQLSELPDF